MENSIVGSDAPQCRDWWPLTRLLVVGLGLYAARRVLPGWREPLVQLSGLAGEMLGTAFSLLFLSPVVAHFYLGFMVLPLVVFILLNDWIYEAAAGGLRLLTHSLGGLSLRWSALGIELSAFIALAELLRRSISAL